MSAESIQKLRARLARAEAREATERIHAMVSFRAEDSLVERLNEVCAFLGKTRSEYVRELVAATVYLPVVSPVGGGSNEEGKHNG